MNSSQKEFFRYVIVGLSNNGLAYIVFLGITFLHVEPKLAMTIVYVACAALGYIGHKKWTFTHEGSNISTSARYVIAHTMGYFLNLLILYALFDILSYPYQLVQVFAILTVAVFLFITFKYFVFTKK